VNRLIFLLILIFLNNCSLNEGSKIWTKDQIEKNKQEKLKKVFNDNKKIIEEFNSDLRLELENITTNNKIIDNKNNYGSQSYNGDFKKIDSLKFKKLKNINQLNHHPIFLNEGMIFFENKGTIIKYGENNKILWKNNHYSKAEKKLFPKLYFIKDNQNLIVADSISKLYSIDINTGNLNWSKYNEYPFNSNIKKDKDKFFVIDYNNTLRCYFINDGTECWNVKTEGSFTLSNTKTSLILVDNKIIFNNSVGEITAVNIETGMLLWQLPTQSSNIVYETYNFQTSELVSDGNSIYFSNNKNEFYSIDVNSGSINWINKINSNISPIIIENLIFTVSNEGFLFVIEKNKGNIIRITDVYIQYKKKNRSEIQPIGFTIGNKNLYLTNSDGKIIIVDLTLGDIIKIEKVSGNLVSKPLIFKNHLYLIRNGKIDKYN
tara:strand:+ start:126 stop:1421 length:1296 start_codon:yes stop_codon:yes gene_type:complete